jgi:hypothetical protein
MKKEQLFNKVANKENYKLPTIPFVTDDEDEADKMMKAICYFVGGAEKSKIGINGKTFTVTSRGYYHYIGA